MPAGPHLSRRHVLAGLGRLVGLSALSAGTSLWLAQDRGRGRVISAARRHDGSHAIVAVHLDGRVAWTFDLAVRGHDVVATSDGRLIAAFARRPGRAIWLLDAASGRLVSTIHAPRRHQFNGHGVFSADGRLLLATETAFSQAQGSDRAAPRGVIGIYDVASGSRETGVPTGALDPHQCVWCDDALVVAHGGYVESPDGADKHLDAQRPPELTWLDAQTGAVRRRDRLPDPALSIRHLDAARGQVWVGFQHDAGSDAPGAELMGHAGPRQSLTALEAPTDGWARFHGYVGSVAVTGSRVVATSPRGSVVGVWHHSGRFDRLVPAADVCGAGVLDGRWVASTGAGALAVDGALSTRLPMAFDNHLTVV